MADVDIIAMLTGPNGVVVGLAIAAGVLWRRHTKDVEARNVADAATIEYERTARHEAEERLGGLGETLKDAADVMEKSVLTTDKVVELIRERGREG